MLSSTSGRDYVHKTLVPLLCNTGSIFETLESHQVSVQSACTCISMYFCVCVCVWNLDECSE